MFGIIGAMSVEIDAIVDKITDKQVFRYNGLTFNQGYLCGCCVVICKCGIGKVNAAMATMLMKAKFDVDTIIMFLLIHPKIHPSNRQCLLFFICQIKTSHILEIGH